MQKLHLNYDGNQNNGIIFNDKYTRGALFVGTEYKPKLSFEYDSMQMSEVFENQDMVMLNGVQRVMTEEEAQEVKELAIKWVQPLGQEGNPTEEQKQEQKNNEARAYLASTDWYVVRKQETGVDIPQTILDARQEARDSIIHVGEEQ